MLKDVLDQLGSLTPEEKRAVRRAAHEPADISLPGKHRLVWAKPRRGPLRLERKKKSGEVEIHPARFQHAY